MVEALPPAAVDPLPDLPDGEPIVLESPVRAQVPCEERGEELVRLEGGAITPLHTYLDRGWSAAVEHCWVRAGVADRLDRVARRLPPGFGLGVFDGWRSMDLQRALFESAYAAGGLPPGFVAPPAGDRAPPHTTGGTVDVTLTWRGAPLALGTGFDDFTDVAHATAFEGRPGPIRALRRLLWHTMRSAGFSGYPQEWWHYSYGNQEWAAYAEDRPCRYLATTPPGHHPPHRPKDFG